MTHPARAIRLSRPVDPPWTRPEAEFRNVLVAAQTEGHGRVDREFLKKARVFTPRVVHSARQALEVLSRHGADLILCDGRLRDASGLDLVAAIKDHPRHRLIPVIMVSLENRREAVIEAARLGVCGYLLRPYSQAAFARHLALARAMRDFTAQAAAEMTRAARETLSGRTRDDPSGQAVPVPPLPGAGNARMAALSVDEAPRFYRLGLKRLASGEFEAAAQAFSRATAINALYVEAHLGLAETWRVRGDVRRYREAMKRAASACVRARRFEELRDRFAAMLKTDREGFNPFFALGNESLRSRDYQGAVAAYRDALSLTPDKGDILVQMGKAYHFLRRKDLAAQAVTRGMELGMDSAEVKSLFHRLTGRDPDALGEMGADREQAGADLPWAFRVACRVAGLVTEGLYKLRRQAREPERPAARAWSGRWDGRRGPGVDFCPGRAHTGRMGRESTTIRARRAPFGPPVGLSALPALIVVLACVLVFPPAVAAAGEMSPERKIRHVVSRLTYGPAPGDLERVRAMGVEAFVREQLEPDAIPRSRELSARLEALGTTRLGTVDLFREHGPTPDTAGGLGPDQVLAARDRAGIVAREAAEARLLRAVADPAQLRELLVEFWYNHFNVDAGKGLARIWAGAFEREAIRPYVLGRFLDLLAATATHPAMLIALDNWRNVAPRGDAAPPEPAAAPGDDEPGDKASSATPGIDATYARTLLAVHTLGDPTAFSENDVAALARVFTGWRIGAPRSETDKNGFLFDRQAHDPTDKTLLGTTIPGGGMAEGAAALRLLAGHPSTARHVSRGLAAYFLAVEPPPALVERLAEVYLDTGGEIRAVLAALFAAAEFFDEKHFRAGFKSPLRHVVSAVRATGAMPDDATPMAGYLARMGAPLYHCPDPAGWPLAPAGPPTARDMAARVSFAADLVSGRLPLWREPPKGLDPDALRAALGEGAEKAGTKAVNKAAGKTAQSAPAAGDKVRAEAAAILAGPDFVRY